MYCAYIICRKNINVNNSVVVKYKLILLKNECSIFVANNILMKKETHKGKIVNYKYNTTFMC